MAVGEAVNLVVVDVVRVDLVVVDIVRVNLVIVLIDRNRLISAFREAAPLL